MGKTCLTAWRTLFLQFQLITAIYGATTAISSSQVKTESSSRSEPAAQVVFQTSSVSQGYQPTGSRKPQFLVTRHKFRADPYTIRKPTMEAQDRIFNELVTAATIVPKLFGASDKPFWVPHKYFNLCPTIPPGSDSLWAMGCQGFPNQVSNGHHVPWASQQATATAGGGEAGSGGGWSLAPMAPFANPIHMGPNNVLGFPPGYLGFPSMYPYYANPNPSMPPPAFPQFVNNNEATAIDMGNMFTSSGPSTGSSTLSSMFFNSLGMGGNPAVTGNQLNNGMALYSGSGNGGVPQQMPSYTYPMAIGIIPMGYGYGLPGAGWPSDWNRHEKNQEREASAASASSSARGATAALRENGNGDGNEEQE